MTPSIATQRTQPCGHRYSDLFDRCPFCDFGDQMFRSVVKGMAPGVTMAYAVEDGGEHPRSIIVCTKPPCVSPGPKDGPPTMQHPLDQADLNELAMAQNAPVACDRCGAFLTEVVAGSDPRD